MSLGAPTLLRAVNRTRPISRGRSSGRSRPNLREVSMTNEELRSLFESTTQCQDELVSRYERGERMSRKDCLSMQRGNARLHAIGRELWIRQGCPPGFECFEQPHVNRKLPVCFRPLDLTRYDGTEVH